MSKAGRIFLIGAVLSSAVAFAGGPQPGDLFGSTGNAGASLIGIDPSDGSSFNIGALGTLGPVSEIEFHPDGTLFGTTGGGTANLIVIDPATGGETLVGEHDLFGATNGLAFVGSTLYGSFFGVPKGPEGTPPTWLVIVDQDDASLTVIGEIEGYSPVRGLAYHAPTATMYGVGSPLAMKGLGDDLFTVDLTTGEPTLVGSTGGAIGSIAFGPDGTLYAGTTGGGGGALGDGPLDPEGGSALLLTIDLASGATTVVGETGAPAISGLAFVPGGGTGPGANPLEIPTVGVFGALVLAGLLAVAGFVVLRR